MPACIDALSKWLASIRSLPQMKVVIIVMHMTPPPAYAVHGDYLIRLCVTVVRGDPPGGNHPVRREPVLRSSRVIVHDVEAVIE